MLAITDITKKIMIININFSAETPIYVQLRNQIIEGIAIGELKRGESLPSIRQLAVDIGVNMHTVNKTYKQLKTDGYIVIHKRRGVLINPNKIKWNGKYVEKLEEKIRPIIAESICQGLKEKDFFKHCLNIYKNLNPGVQK